MRASTTLLNGSEERTLEEATSHPAEQIVRKLRRADRLLGEGMELPEVVKICWRSRRRAITAGGRSMAG